MKSFKNKISNSVKSKFATAEIIRRKDLYDFLEQNFFPDLKESTFRWRIYELKKSNVIIPITRGVYKLYQNKRVYEPSVNKRLKKISRLLLYRFRDLSYCIWNSNWLNEFSRHQAAINIIFVEAEKELVHSIFNLLLDNSYKNVYIEPDRFITQTYISENQTSIIIKPLISKSPVQLVYNVKIPKLEKILADLFSDDKYLNAYKGHEQITVFKNAFTEYQINISRLINYSRRRKKNKQLMDFLIQNLNCKKELLK